MLSAARSFVSKLNILHFTSASPLLNCFVTSWGWCMWWFTHITNPPFPPQFACMPYLALYMCQTRLWRRHLRACIYVVWDRMSGLSLQHTHTRYTLWFLSLNNSACSFSEKPCCAALRVALVMRCNRIVCSYYLRDFISGVTHTHSLPPVKPPFTSSSSSLQVLFPFLLYFHFFCRPLSTFLLLAFSIFTWIP